MTVCPSRFRATKASKKWTDSSSIPRGGPNRILDPGKSTALAIGVSRGANEDGDVLLELAVEAQHAELGVPRPEERSEGADLQMVTDEEEEILLTVELVGGVDQLALRMRGQGVVAIGRLVRV